MAHALDLVHTLRNRWPLATLVSAAAVPMLGCVPGAGEDSFRITAIDFDGDSSITLTFSKPIANADQIDPNDFRISYAQTTRFVYTYYGVTNEYVYTSYRDVGAINYNYYNYEPPTRFLFASASLGASDDQLVLETAVALGTDECARIEQSLDSFEMYSQYYPGSQFDVAMFLHYAAGSIPVESELGERIADIGRDWVLTDELSNDTQTYGFVDLSPQLRIPCP